MTDVKIKADVVRIDMLDGVEVWRTKPRRRNVFTRANGSHYIITLGHREDVFLQEDDTFIEYQIAHRVNGGIAV